jgi:FtsP/CotA-like multicopper oxidase with cupredoxin domain
MWNGTGRKEVTNMPLLKVRRKICFKRNSENGKLFGGKTVRYDLYVKDTIVNFTGKNRRAIAINGKLQAPTLYFTEGDTAEIYLHNMLKENTGCTGTE